MLLSYKPYTSSIRHVCLLDTRSTNHLYKIDALMDAFGKKYSGRNNSGHITVKRKVGTLSKKSIKVLNFGLLDNVSGTVLQIQFDSNRSAFIALIRYMNGVYSYILAYNGIQINDPVVRFKYIPEVIYTGSMSKLATIPAGNVIYNVEQLPGFGGIFGKSAGTYCIFLKRTTNVSTIKLPSKQLRECSSLCLASIGSVGNEEYQFTNVGKAGRSIHLGHRPKVRGVAMNPVDHPHGGGEGKKSKPVCPKNAVGHRVKWNKTKRKK
jgi:large subunit ribosomal protein L2